MRRVVYALVVVAFALSAVAAPGEGPEWRGNPIVKAVKKAVKTVKTLGDGITIPVGGPKP